MTSVNATPWGTGSWGSYQSQDGASISGSPAAAKTYSVDALERMLERSDFSAVDIKTHRSIVKGGGDMRPLADG